ncbi:TniQ family protein [Streptomyces sp. NPDC058619]|uniref:TniQ family protein n=1 Tax=Streptomyces sp. NPDC058619 TaxID=3346559 RepID=UPI003654405B
MKSPSSRLRGRHRHHSRPAEVDDPGAVRRLPRADRPPDPPSDGHAHWRFYGTTSRYCPACLAQSRGRWQLRWRLGWTFACPRHLLLLLERCPVCGKHPPVASGGNHRMLPRPEACRALTGRTGHGCGAASP